MLFFHSHNKEKTKKITIPTVGLLVHYAFEGNTNDSSVNESHATIANIANTEFVSGYDGVSKGLRIIGNDSSISTLGGHVVLPFLEFQDYEGYSFNFWYKKERVGYNVSHGEAIFSIGLEGGTCLQIFQKNNWVFRIANNGQWYSLGSHQAEDTSWNMISLTYDDSTKTFKIYVNAQLINTLTGTSLEPVTYKHIFLGRHDWGGGRGNSTRLTAVYDEFFIYNRALEEQEILGLYGS